MQAIKRIYFVWLIIILVCTAVSFATLQNKVIRAWKYENAQIGDSAITVTQSGGDLSTFVIPGQEVTEHGDSLVFLTSHQFVKVYVGNNLIYSAGLADRWFGNSPGDLWNFVSIPQEAEEIRVELTAAYPQSRDPEIVFLAGNAVSLYRTIIKENLVAALISLVNLFFGLLLVVFWAAFHKKEKAFDALLYFGIFNACVGAWAFVENSIPVLLAEHTGALNVAAYFCLLLMPVACVLFLKESLDIREYWGHILCCVYSLSVMTVCTLFMLFNLADFKQMAIWIHLGLLMVIVYMAYGIVQKIRNKSMNRHAVVVLIAMGSAFAALVLELMKYYTDLIRSGSIGLFGLLICVLLLASETFVDTFNQVEEGRKAIYYKQMASVDTLTGVYNRNAFMEDTSTIEDSDSVFLVTFDLNDLKKTNDTKGHEVGDRYLIDSAAAISYVFSQSGNCYRIGGDEFCVVIKNDTAEHVESMIARLKRCEEDYNNESSSVVMKIACGYATFDPARDRNLEETRTRADARMYADKVEMKAKYAAKD